MEQLTKIWVAIGDSFTYIDAHIEETGNRIQKGYLTRTREKLPFKTELINIGINGGKTREWREATLPKGDFYTILLGTNDWWAGLYKIGDKEDFLQEREEETVLGNLGILVRRIKKINPTAKIFIMNPVERGTFVYVFDWVNHALDSTHKRNGVYLKDVSKAIYECARGENIIPVNLNDRLPFTPENVMKFYRVKKDGKICDLSFEEFHADPFSMKMEIYPYPLEAMRYMCDGLHPNDLGYEMIADILAEEIIKNL